MHAHDTTHTFPSQQGIVRLQSAHTIALMQYDTPRTVFALHAQDAVVVRTQARRRQARLRAPVMREMMRVG